MDYEKKYNDALNLAKSYYGKGSNEFLDTIFPELRESEDERDESIRKFLVDYFASYKIGDVTTKLNGVRIDDILNYLEKQKGQKIVYEDEYQRMLSDSYKGGKDEVVGNPEKYGLQKEQKLPITGNDFGWIDELMHDLKHPEELDEKVQEVLKKEQKPAGWSEDIIRKAVKEVGLTQHQIDWFKTNVFPPKSEWSEEDREMIQSIITNGCVDDKQERWLRMLPERICQPKQEWSEEDEKMLDEVLDKVTYAVYNQGLDGEIEDDPAFLWLHRLRPSWKPSEEQMRVLKQVEDRVAMKSGYWEQVLDSLYCDLQKL